MRTMAGMCPAIQRSRVIGLTAGKFCANIIWPCRFECCAMFRGSCGSRSGTSLAPDCLAFRRLPALRLLVALRVAIKRALEVPQGDDKARPAAREAELEYIMFQERPDAVSEGAPHRHPFVRELGHAECRIAVHLVDDLLEIAERKLPARIFQPAYLAAADFLVAFVHRLERVADAAFAEEL